MPRNSYLIAIGTAVLIAGGWLLPLTAVGAVLMLIGMGGLVLLIANLRALYLCGVLTYLAAFWWLAPTISTFSGLPHVVSVVLFAAFCAASALQFPWYGWLAQRIERALERVALSFPYGKAVPQIISPALGWLAAEALFFRIFPWTPAHALLPYREIAQLAALLSASGLTLVLFTLITVLVRGKQPKRFVYIGASVLALHIFGAFRIQYIELAPKQSGQELAVALVQGNIPVLEKVDDAKLLANIRTHIQLSQKAEEQNPALIVWPETVILDPLPRDIARLPGLAAQRATVLLGALMQEGRSRFFNSAFALAPISGQRSQVYDKRVLVPYGEYTPLGDYFPWMREINRNAAEFVPGAEQTRITVPFGIEGKSSVQVAPLICYEDVIPGPAHKAVALGARLLVNMSNDGWFGISAAAKQHHQIASFRAIENGVPLLRVTNSGFTAIVDPTGRTTDSLPEHQVGVLHASVMLSDLGRPMAATLNALWRWIGIVLLFVAVAFGRPLRNAITRVTNGK